MRKKYWIIISGMLLIGMLFAGNRLVFGVWNPLSSPDRFECFGRRYYISSLAPTTLSESEMPEYSINSWVWAGKALYSSEPKGVNIPTIIYLKMANGKYQLYALSGSN